MAEDQRAFVTQTRDLLTWLGELRGVTAADEDELRSCRLALDEHWDDWLPLERDVLFDELAAVYCDSCAADRPDLDSVRSSPSLPPLSTSRRRASADVDAPQPTFRAFKHHLAVFAPPTEVSTTSSFEKRLYGSQGSSLTKGSRRTRAPLELDSAYPTGSSSTRSCGTSSRSTTTRARSGLGRRRSRRRSARARCAV